MRGGIYWLCSSKAEHTYITHTYKKKLNALGPRITLEKLFYMCCFP